MPLSPTITSRMSDIILRFAVLPGENEDYFETRHRRVVPIEENECKKGKEEDRTIGN